MNPDRIGLTKKVTVGISGDAKLVAKQLLNKLSPKAGEINRQKKKIQFIKLNQHGCKNYLV